MQRETGDNQLSRTYSFQQLSNSKRQRTFFSGNFWKVKAKQGPSLRGHPLRDHRGPQMPGSPATVLVTQWDGHSLWTLQFYSALIWWWGYSRKQNESRRMKHSSHLIANGLNGCCAFSQSSQNWERSLSPLISSIFGLSKWKKVSFIFYQLEMSRCSGTRGDCLLTALCNGL